MRLATFLALIFACGLGVARGQTTAASATSAELLSVVVVTRHGVRSPTNPDELSRFVAYPMAAWEVAPGDLTPRGATLMTMFGRDYRSFYAAAHLWPAAGCPAANSVFVWADVDRRTKATAAALLEGLAPRCGLVASDAGTAVDPLFHALPSVGRADPVTSFASVAGSTGQDPAAVVRAHRLAFAKLDAILGCDGVACQRISDVPMTLTNSSKTGLTGIAGPVDLASTAVEDFILAYADGKPSSDIGKGAIDGPTLLELSELHMLKSALAQTPYVARAQGSNLLAHVVATIDQGATGARNRNTRAPLGARFVAFVGHDTNLEEFAEMLNLRWLIPGYQPGDTPPGGALVFETYRSAGGAAPFVQTFFEAQSLEHMRHLAGDAPDRVAVFVPGCPGFDCPITTFDRVMNAAIDPTFVSPW